MEKYQELRSVEKYGPPVPVSITPFDVILELMSLNHHLFYIINFIVVKAHHNTEELLYLPEVVI